MHIEIKRCRLSKIQVGERTVCATNCNDAEAMMARRLITDKVGRFTVDVYVNGTVLSDALERDDTEQVLKCALIAALSVLAQGGPWPLSLLDTMGEFMDNMRRLLREEALV